ncbi:hypothetical protein EMPS_02555 [Entomortierella parvispora]|uniref:FAD-binding PCMH-type domain-containing protein n=1 Tax=Entomortierella parvispora TaxID=205924 RepID=A0A9P3H4Y3_9FUNG|nr:hypothetical protein EMPS_02555 [Entomortierella parvispora]
MAAENDFNADNVAPMEIPGFRGQVFTRNGAGYATRAYQYGSSSYATQGTMQPRAIYCPLDDDDVIKVIRYAQDKNIAVAVRTGGHQYCGASSTFGDNIQLDLSETYQAGFEWENDDTIVTVGVSHSLRDFNAKLTERGRFVPHGQCSQVYLGGHVQTGGYGQLGRSFGLLADHVEKFRIITALDCKPRWVTRGVRADEDLFFAVLGGSPGNFGVLTHVTIRVHKDSDHNQSRGLKAIYPYDRDRLKRLLDDMVTMTEQTDFPADYDYCVTVLSQFNSLLFPPTTLDEQMVTDLDRNQSSYWPPMIIVYAQWANLEGSDQEYDSTFFNDIKQAASACPLSKILVDNNEPTAMSRLAASWIFQNVREFNLPYVKRAYMSNSTTLRNDGWTDWVSDRVQDIQGALDNGCKLSVQIQHFGGTKSRFYRNDRNEQGEPRNTTSFSWRDSNICCVLDCFYSEGSRPIAEGWQAGNDEGVGSDQAKFCVEDRRVLWGSHDPNLHDVHKYYYEEASGKYERLCKIKREYDPTGVFTPNGFCVGSSAVVRQVGDQARQLAERVESLSIAPAFNFILADAPAPYDEHVLQQAEFLRSMANDEPLAEELQRSRDLQHQRILDRLD